MGKLSLYWNTVRYMKSSQIYYRLCKMAGLKCSLGCKVKDYSFGDSVRPVATVKELDFDPFFLRRFPVKELLQNHVTFLYEAENMDWNGSWNYPDRSALWNFNLHYFEYLLPLAEAYHRGGDIACLNKIKESILGWIRSNPMRKGGNAWSAYTISLRLTNWLSTYTWLKNEIDQDECFARNFLKSIHEQFRYLALHLEKDLLGNHYFEDLKALVLCSLFFEDEVVFEKSIKQLRDQCAEQILPDGMHFELSPMYHKIILEDILRVAVSLRGAGRPCAEIEGYLQPMVDAAYSMEHGLERLPLFNDCGSNVSKSLTALCNAAESLFGVHPVKKLHFPNAGYYIFEHDNLRLIVDAGKPGPEYLPGHAHCDCMSFELFKEGKPILINCGTYAYQCNERLCFKSTSSHNTVMVDGIEQSRCWGVFRMAKRSSVKVLRVTDTTIEMEMFDQMKNRIYRSLSLKNDGISIVDSSAGNRITSFVHCIGDVTSKTTGLETKGFADYAQQFGVKTEVPELKFTGNELMNIDISLN